MNYFIEQIRINFLLYKNYFTINNKITHNINKNIIISLKSHCKLTNNYILIVLNEFCNINDIEKITYEKIYNIKNEEIFDISNIKKEKYNYYISFNKIISNHTNKFLDYIFLAKNFNLNNIIISSNNYKMNRPNHSVF
tara:strand:+ start:777 stop:1190 length:414 start_codon:yes stop_codon:yes gene_type:complete